MLGTLPPASKGVTPGATEMAGDGLECWHWMEATDHSQRPKGFPKFCCLGFPLLFAHNLIISHIRHEGKYKLGELPIYLLGNRDM